ncbi:MAG: hypothetical protein JO257_24340 [Deltaproteobacteria bacterium]|nr:hypothetical protein [Deltaproteobacteria bacterium]
MEIARGNVTDRPWALTLATIARRRVTGEITLVSNDKHYAIAFDHGAVVAARSPMTVDTALRVALTSRLVSPARIHELQRLIAARRDADEIDLLGDAAALTADQRDALRTEVITRAAARTFAPEHGNFVVDDTITLPTRAFTVDISAIVYYGIRTHVSDARLSNELRMLGGSYFLLDPQADLHSFGFTDTERPLLASLRAGITMPELEAHHRDIDPRTMIATIYALVACGAVQVTAPPHPSRVPTTPLPSRVPTTPRVPTAPLPSRVPTAPLPPRTPTPRASEPAVAVSRTQSATIPRTTTPTSSIHIRTPNPPRIPATQPAPRGRRPSDMPPNVTLARGTVDNVEPPAQTKTNAELAAEAAERAQRALAAHDPQSAVLDLKKAVELVPNNVDYNALLGWALFCAADDKAAIAAESRKALEKAVYKSDHPEVAQFYLGRIERMLGRDKEALRHFQAVLDTRPDHRDASAEVRVLQARLKRLGIDIQS